MTPGNVSGASSAPAALTDGGAGGNTPVMNFTGFWFRCPDELDTLLALPAVHLKVFLIVMRAQERDRNGGKLSVRRIWKQLDTGSLGYVSEVLKALCAKGLLEAEGGIVHGRLSTFRVPVRFRGDGNCSTPVEQSRRKAGANCSTPVEQLGAGKDGNCSPNCSTPVEQNCSTPVEQHSSSSEREEKDDSDSLSVSADDDETPEGLTRFLEGKHPGTASEILGFIRQDLEARGLTLSPEFVRFIRENATGNAHNPQGLYRSLVKRYAAGRKAEVVERSIAIRQAVKEGLKDSSYSGSAAYPCCGGSGKAQDGSPCSCRCGDDLRAIQARMAAPRASQYRRYEPPAGAYPNG